VDKLLKRFWRHHMREGNTASGKRSLAHGRTGEHSLMDEPAAKRSCRAHIGFDGAPRALSASRGWRLTQGGNPGTDICFGDLADVKEMALGKQIVLQLTQRRLMPFQRLRTMPGCVVGLQIGVDRLFDGQGMASPS
jgi:hypothetical protein